MKFKRSTVFNLQLRTLVILGLLVFSLQNLLYAQDPCPNDVNVICNDGVESIILEADAGLTNVIWYNEADEVVGNGSQLIITSATLGLEDGSDSFYYTGDDPDGCPGELCCPVVIELESCNSPPEEGFFPCACEEGAGTNQVDLVAVPVPDNDQVCIDLSNEGIVPSEVDSAEVWFFTRSGSGNKPTQVTFTSDNGYTDTQVTGDGIPAGGGGYYYRTVFPTDVGQICVETQGAIVNARSLGAFVYQSTPTGLGGFAFEFVGDYIYHNGSGEDCFNTSLPLTPSDDPNTVVVQVAIEDVEQSDPRTIDFSFTASGIDYNFTESGPTFVVGELAVYEFTLNNIPATADELLLDICSVASNNGQSAYPTGIIVNSSSACDCEFDLALRKTLQSSGPFTPGDNVTFNIEVINQGELEATDIQVTDYIPSGLTLADGNWDNLGGTATLVTPIASLAPGASTNVTITFTIDANFEGDRIVNFAEISAADNYLGLPDIDSTPDGTNGNDAGGVPDTPSDNAVNGDGTGTPEDSNASTDEDDHDPAVLMIVQSFDLALSKILNTTSTPGPFAPGDDVTFTITITNQGTITGTDIQVADYVPEGLTLNDSDWNYDAVTDQAFLAAPIASLASGASTTRDITFTIDSDFMGDAIRNWAEISEADNALDLPDVDSNPDSDNFNSPGETNDLDDDNTISEDGKNGGDEDDHDPAEIMVGQIFDLALTKKLDNTATPGPFAPGDNVTFVIEVFNQGTLNATDIQVTDYIPTGLTLNDPNWVAGLGSTATLVTPIPSLAAGTSTTVEIAFVIDADFMGDAIRNWAEISGASNELGQADIDSDPDGSQFNSPGETDDLGDDNVVDQDGKNGGDEDDHDPAEIMVGQVFDLALRKTINKTATPGPWSPGSTVTFTIEVINQGSLDATDIEVSDYVPTGLTLSDANWSMTGTTASLNDPIASLAAGASTTVDISFTIDADFQGGELVNRAEISDASNELGVDDIDSTPDGTNGNDAGGEPGTPSDDAVNGDGSGNPGDQDPSVDEDDEDPALVPVLQTFDLALEKDLNTTATPGPFAPGDDVTFTINVYNQGTLDATSIEVVDYVPEGLTLNDANWDYDAVTGKAFLNTPIASLASGASTSVNITFTIDADFMGDAIRNWAEIADADNALGEPDVDSDPDSDNFNNTGETDDLDDDGITNENGKDGGDEDDHDPAEIMVGQIFDLALNKKLDNTATPGPFAPGDNVTFVIEVFNQGTLNATDIQVTDYIPTGLTLNDPNWVAGLGSTATLATPIPSLAAGTSTTVEIAFVIDADFMGDVIRNWAEISAASNALGEDDIDSDPDGTQFNSPGETDDLNDDDVVNQDGKNGGDEDDHDPAEIMVGQVFDLALTKKLNTTLTPGPFSPGSTVTFTIEVINQGSLDATDIEVSDYVPTGLTLSDANWSMTGTIASLNDPIASLAAGASTTVDISFTIDADFQGGEIVNRAEISGSDNELGEDDVDSTEDQDPNNDGGGEPDSPSDDAVNGDGSGDPGDEDPSTDEDDADPVLIEVDQTFDLALDKVLNTTATPGPFEPGDAVTFTITIYNQGTLDATGIEVVDYVPEGLTLNDANWDYDAVTGKAFLNPPVASLAAGAQISRDITFTIDADYQNDAIRNWAEIADADNALGEPDVDSDPDSDNFNQPGETDDLGDDNVIDQNGKNGGDEDDHDPAEIMVGQVFDLALIKQLDTEATPGPFAPGDNVTFVITITNQGTLDAQNIQVTDYVPEGLTLNDPDWTDNGGLATLNDPIAFLAAGDVTTVGIAFTIDADFMDDRITNIAEISSSDNELDQDDIDSPEDQNPDDPIGQDDAIDGENGDEDNHDPAEIMVGQVFDLALNKKINTNLTPGPFAPGDEITFVVEVFNQGTIDAQNIQVTDYIPTGLTLNDGAWTQTGNLATNNTLIPSLAVGASTTLNITFTIDADFQGDEIINRAEISGSENDLDLDDIDSTEDQVTGNDAGGNPNTSTDNSINGDGSGNPGDEDPITDEDDEDPALVNIEQTFDLALDKVLNTTATPGPFEPGDDVTFTINVYNQGTLDATSIEVVDYVPEGFTLNDANWDYDAVSNEAYLNTPISSLAAGASTSVQITFTIDEDYMDDRIRNWAEIADADNALGLEDVDSDPDSDNFNSTGETDDLNDDDVVDQDGKNGGDEDDHDPAEIVVGQIFDLALRKRVDEAVSPGPFAPGSPVTFKIEVFNQGTLDAQNIQITDYIPDGLILDDPDWTQVGDEATLLNPILFLGVDESVEVEISFLIEEDFMDDQIVNYAEISSAENELGQDDIDSTPDDFNDNDAGGEPESPADDEINGDGTGTPGDDNASTDEDDHDPALIQVGQVFDLALIKVLNTTLTPGPFAPGDDITFTIEVFNQGTLDATDIVISDYIPTGLILNDGAWTEAGGIATINTPIAFLAEGASTTVDITFTIDPDFQGGEVVNRAEISDADNELDLDDVDSTPDDMEGNDAGGNPDTPSDDSTGGDGTGDPGDQQETTDEDDEDPSRVEIVQTFDLALDKKVNTGATPGPYSPGDDVTFTITVYNQGTIDATNVEITDYVPEGFTLNDSNWDFDPVNNEAYLNSAIAFIAKGDEATVDITFTIDLDYQGATVRNWAEISDAENELDLEDIDSDPDGDNFNSPGETDDLTDDDVVDQDGKNGGDEDDHDPAEIDVQQIFDLALRKRLDEESTPGPFVPGSAVTFKIEVFNQGTLDATNVQISDYIPEGLILNDPDWSQTGDVATIISPIAYLAAGGNTEIDITFTIDPEYQGDIIDNYAEISDAENELGLDDIDSTPDQVTDNDAGGQPETPADDMLGGDGSGTPGDDVSGTDEDDHDPARIQVGQTFDLALVKKINTGITPGPYAPGDNITYEIEVINQGTLDAQNIQVTDYIPTGLILNDSDWSAVGGAATLNSPIALLEDGESTTVNITFMIDPDFMGDRVINYAEISDAENELDLDDIDSTPDGTNGNDAGGEPESPSDDSTGGDGSGDPGDIDPTTDEDDHDPAVTDIIQVFDLALDKVLNDNETPGPFAPGDDVTFTITVYNQGSLDATEIQVIDYIPEGLILNDTDWSFDAANNVAYLNNPIASLLVGEETSVDITFSIDDDFMGTHIRNWAEINDASNELGYDDIDSTPDDENFNSSGETNDLADDNVIDEDGKADGDEDDHDPAEIMVGQVFDLALRKRVDPESSFGPVYPGDEATFEITVYNQGTVTAQNIELVDYIPVGLELNDADWVEMSGSAFLIDRIPELKPGEFTTIDITYTVTAEFVGNTINWAEISDAENELGLDDIDSDPDSNNTNDAGGSPETPADDQINGDGTGTPGDGVAATDEDDHDPALLVVCSPDPIVICCGEDYLLTRTLLGNTLPDGYVWYSVDGTNREEIATTSYVDNDGNTVYEAVVNEPGTYILQDPDGTCEGAGCCPEVLEGEEEVPTWAIDPADVTYECDSREDYEVLYQEWLSNIVDNPDQYLDDNCLGRGTDATITYDEATNTLCSNNDIPREVTVIFTPFDGCGNEGEQRIAKFAVEDSEGPVFDPNMDYNLAIRCTDTDVDAQIKAWADAIADAVQDTCSLLDVSYSYDSTQDVPLTCEPSEHGMEVLFTAVDGCGNETQKIGYVSLYDDVAPVVVMPGRDEYTNDCGVFSVFEFFTWLDNNAYAIYEDECSAIVNWTNDYRGPFPYECGQTGSIDVEFTATDNCGNATSFTRTFTIEDNQPPVWIIEPQDITVECRTGFDIDAIVDQWLNSQGNGLANDDCSNLNITYTYDQDPGALTPCDANGNPTVATVEFTATDECGNSTPATATVTYLDELPPVLTCPADMTVECDIDLAALNAALDNHFETYGEVSDACDNDVNVEVVDLTVVPGTCENGQPSITPIEVIATDACGNVSTCYFNLEVRDETAPEITNCPDNVSLDCAEVDDFDFDNWLNTFAATDNCSDANTLELTNSFDASQLDVPCQGTEWDNHVLTVTFTATDACGNETTCEATITVTDDVDPVITCPDDLELECGEAGNEALIASWLQSAKATDNCDTDVAVMNDFDMNDLDELDGSCNGTDSELSLTVTFMATDNCGNVSMCEATITVVDDTDPEITCPALGDLELECGNEDNYNELVDWVNSASATDNCSNNVDITIDPNISELRALIEVSTACPDPVIIPVVFTATDECGNTAECSSEVVIRDNTAPEITACPERLEIACDPTADYEQMIVDYVEQNLEFGDDCQLVTFEDHVSIDIQGDLSAVCPDDDIPAMVTVEVTVTDDCGNTSNCDFEVVVVDRIAPEITNCPESLSLDCGKIGGYNFDNWLNTFMANDNCSSGDDLTLTNTFDPSQLSVPCSGSQWDDHVLTVTFTATDACGNSVSCEATITVTDDSDPSLTCPDNLELECGEEGNDALIAAWLESATATDNCDTDVNITHDFNPEDLADLDGGCDGDNIDASITVTFTAVDNCGNEVSCEATISIVDNTDPVIACPALGDLELECGDADNYSEVLDWIESASATDNCSKNVDITTEPSASALRNQIELNGACPDPVIIPVVFIATDECGNTARCNSEIVIRDNTAPEITACPERLEIACDPTADYDQMIVDYVAQNLQYRDACQSLTFDGNVTIDIQGDLSAVCLGDDVPATATVVITVADDCGNSTNCSFEAQVVDRDAPVIENCPENIVLECSDVHGYDFDAWLATFAATDNCSGEGALHLTNDYDHGLMDEPCSVNEWDDHVLTVTFTATDACGNATSCEATITVKDDVDPVIDCPDDLVVDCGADNLDGIIATWLSSVSATDDCDREVSISNDYGASDLVYPCGNGNGLTVTFTAVDNCGNEATCSADIIITDEIDPELNCPSGDLVLECGHPDNAVLMEGWINSASATDNCDNDVRITTSLDGQDLEDVIAGNSPCSNGENPGVITVIFTATDNCGNDTECSADIIIRDTEAPQIACSESLRLECGNYEMSDIENWLNSVSATDMCLGEVVVVNDFDAADLQAPCLGDDTSFEMEITFVATDDCGNRTQCISSIIVSDNTAPSLVCPQDELDLDCSLTEEEIHIAILDWIGTATATDACDNDVEISTNYTFGMIDAPCLGNGEEGKYEIVFTASDNCENTETCVSYVNIGDAHAPEIACPSDLTIICGEDNSDVAIADWLNAVIAFDDCDTDVEIVNNFNAVDLSVACDSNNGLEVVFIATDNCGNQSMCKANIYIIDEDAPEIDCPADLVLECGHPDNVDLINDWLSTTSASDDCDKDIDIRSSIDGQDLDNVLAGLNPCGANDGTLNVTFIATDNCGNANECTAQIRVRDTDEPTIACPESLVIDCAKFGEGASVESWLNSVVATDNCDSNVEVTNNFDESQISAPCLGSIRPFELEVTFTATDDCGNTSQCISTIRIVDDGDPFISCPDEELNIECGMSAEEQHLAVVDWINQTTATDACDDDVEISTNYTYGSLPEPCLNNGGKFEVVFTATDNCGNTSSCSQYINIIDSEAPEFTNVPQDASVDCSEAVVFGTPEFEDECDADVALSYEDAVGTEGCKGESFTRTWTITDNCGNSTSASQTIVVEDNEAPEFTFVPGDITVDCDEEIVFSAPLFEDNCLSDVVLDYVDATNATLCSDEIVTRTWIITDACGNSNTASQKITRSYMNPYFVDQAPDNITVECDQVPESVQLTGLVNCGQEVEIDPTSEILSGQCDGEYTMTRTWTLSDNCGNEVTTEQVIVVVDNTAPVITGVPESTTIDGLPLPELPEVNATDNCSEVELNFDEVRNQNECGLIVIRTWTASDACGNSTSGSQTIFVSPEALEVDLDLVNGVDCYGELDGSVAATVSGGSEPYTYVWSNGETTRVANSLPQGTATVEVYDANGCMGIGTLDVPGPDEALDVEIVVESGLDCNSSGEVRAVISGGTPVYQIDWSNGDSGESTTVNGTFIAVTVTDASGCQDTDEEEVEESCFDLALIKRANTNTVSAGDFLTYTITVYNQGTSPAYGIQVVDQLPSGVTLADNQWQAIGGSKFELINPINFIPAGGSYPVTLRVKIDDDFQGTSLRNVAEISDADDDTDPSNGKPSDDDSTFDEDLDNDIVGGDDTINNENGDEDDHDIDEVEVTPIGDFDLSLEKSTTATSVAVGDLITYTITVTNEGDIDAYNVEVEDRYPSSLTPRGATTAVIPFIPAGGSASVDFQFEVNGNASGSVFNEAEITDAEDEDGNTPTDDDSTPDNDDEDEDDQDGEETPVDSGDFDLSLEKVVAIQKVAVGDVVTYTITVTNEGDIDAYNVEVEDRYPNSLTPRGATTAVIPFIPAGSSASVDFQFEVNDNAGGSIYNEAEITDAEDEDGNTPTDVDSTPDNDDEDEDDQDGVRIKVGCEGDYTEEEIDLPCGEDGFVCLPINYDHISDYEVLLDGNTYDDFYACDIERVVQYDYCVLSDHGENGPYELISWVVDGVEYSTTFQDIHDLVDYMNSVDPDGNWILREDIQLIEGGNGGTYGPMIFKQLRLLGMPRAEMNASIAYFANGVAVNVGDQEGMRWITYNLIGEDCPDTIKVTINKDIPSIDNIITENTCEGSSNGSVEVIVAGNPDNYNFEWTPNVSSTNIADGLSAGSYTVKVSSKADPNCYVIESIEVFELNAPSLSVQVEDANCNGENGTAVVTPSNATTYVWSDGPTTASNERNDLDAGSYTVTATFDNGCSSSTSFEISSSSISITDVDVEDTCPDSNNGSIEITMDGNVNDYTFTWSPNVSSTNSADNLSAGVYTVTVQLTSDLTCSVERSIEVGELNVPALSVQVEDANCNGENGTAVVTPSNATTYVWSDGPTTASNERNDLDAGSYTVTATFGNGCSSSTSFEISSNSISVTDVDVEDTCPDSNNGSIEITMDGNVNDYTFTWSPNVSSTNSADNLSAGVYTVTVQLTSDLTCSVERSIEVGELNVPALSVSTDNASCAGGDGIVTVTPNTGIEYRWSDGSTTVSNTRNDLDAGMYSVTVSFGNGCERSTMFEIDTDNTLSIAIDQVSAATCDLGGTIELTVNGGSGTYTYIWSDNSSINSSMRTGLNPGFYTVSVTDNQNAVCVAQETIEIIDDCRCIGSRTDTLMEIGCNDDARYCTDIEETEAGDWIISVNGDPVTAPYDLCGEREFLRYQYDLLLGDGYFGPFEIVDWTVNGTSYSGTFNNVDEIVSFMNASDPTGNWVLEPSHKRIVGGNFDNTYGPILIKQLRFIVTNRVDTLGIAFGQEATRIAIDLEDGVNEILLQGPDAECPDTVVVTVTRSNDLSASVLYTYPASCNENNGVASLYPVDLTYTWSDGGNGNFRDDLTQGNYKVTASDGTCSTELELNITKVIGDGCADCDYLLPDETTSLTVTDCDGLHDLCIEVNPWVKEGTEFRLDGQIIELTQSCRMDTVQYAYNYTIIPDQGSVGPYMVDAWTINGVTHSGMFDELSDLIDQMNIWDVDGNWSITGTGDIVGGMMNDMPGSLNITQVMTDISVSISPEVLYGPVAYIISVEEGSYMLTAYNAELGCRDTMTASVLCAGGLIANNDAALLSGNDIQVTVDVTENDQLTPNTIVRIVERPSNGWARVNADNSITYNSGLDRCEKGEGDRLRYELFNDESIVEATLNIDFECASLDIPQVISPDGDGINDRFEIGGLDESLKTSVTIYNVLGQMIYHEGNYESVPAWDGSVQNYRSSYSSATYFYVVQQEGKKTYTGYFQVLK